MIDPLNALSLVGSIIQIVDFGLKITSKSKEILIHGTTAEQAHLAKLTSDLSDVYEQLEREAWPRSWLDLCHNEVAAVKLANSGKDTIEELRQLLVNLEVKDTVNRLGNCRRRKRDVVKRALKSTWEDDNLQRLRARLNELQQAMILKLSVLQSESSSSLLQGLGTLSKQASDERMNRLSQFEAIKSDLLAKAAATSAESVDAVERLSKSFTHMSEQITEVAVCQSALNLLVFDEIHTRQENIAAAHARTFEWIFDNPDLGFTHWASSKEGIFWITGKPGSGKSTLMKYLATNPRMKQLLQQWAGPVEVLMSHHYFWNAGTPMQKSQVGLLRNLLYFILRQSPEAAMKAMPRRFRDRNGDKTMSWTLEELRESFQTLGRQPDLHMRFCLFIDGLDEYSGDHIDLIALLSELVEGPNIKLCISSRPWNTFTRAYHNRTDGQITMQDLTSDDIRLYIHDKMESNELFAGLNRQNPQGCSDLISEIMKKAQGVFLWVYLAVRSLFRGLDNDDSLEILHKRLETYPETLDSFFMRMFTRIEEVYRKHSARIMLVAMAETRMPLVFLKYIELEITDPDYALKASALGYACKNRSCGITDKYQRYVDARCADFMEVKHNYVHFIHRTAIDFLRQHTMLDVIRKQAQSEFDVGLSLARLALIRFKCGENFEPAQPGIASIDWRGTREAYPFYRKMFVELMSRERLVDSCNTPKYLELLDQVPNKYRYTNEERDSDPFERDRITDEVGNLESCWVT